MGIVLVQTAIPSYPRPNSWQVTISWNMPSGRSSLRLPVVELPAVNFDHAIRIADAINAMPVTIEVETL